MNETHNEYNLSKIETYFNSLLENNLSEHVFVGGLPKTMGEGWTDAVMIDCDSSVFDLDAYADGIININLYAKPKSDGSKNVATMSRLEQKLNEIIDAASSETYTISRNATYGSYDTNRQWHLNVVQLNLRIYHKENNN